MQEICQAQDKYSRFLGKAMNPYLGRPRDGAMKLRNRIS